MSLPVRPLIRLVIKNQRLPDHNRPVGSPIVPSTRIASMLQKPTWSVKSLLPNSSSPSSAPTVTPQQLHHLLRLSALPPPKNAEEEAEMLSTLTSQLHFVQEIQKVDTEGVMPLCALREETPEAIEEQTIKLEDVREFLNAEKAIGRNGRIKRQARDDPKASEAEREWDPFAMGEQKNKGRYFYVRRAKEETGIKTSTNATIEELATEATKATEEKV